MLEDLIIYTPMYISGFWSVLLLSIGSPSGNKAKFLLGIFMFFAFLLYLSHAVYFHHLFQIFRYFDPVYALCSLSVYPLYFWYIKLLTVELKFRWNNLVLFVPAILIALTTSMIYLLMDACEAEEYIRKFYYGEKGSISRLGSILSIVFYAARIIFGVQVIFFLFLGSKLVRKYNERIENVYSNIEGKSINWVKILLISFVFTSVVSIIFNLLGREIFAQSMLLLLIPSAIFSTLLFLIGIQGLLQNHTLAELIHDEDEFTLDTPRLSSKDKLKTELQLLFKNEKIYLKDDLKITQVAEKLNTNRTYLSNLINEDFGCTFSDFVGEFRVRDAKTMLESDHQQKFAIEYISEQVGFGSTNSFIRVFKKIEGTTPGNYRAQAIAKTLK